MRVLLVAMPWAPIDVPSLALGILRAAAADSVAGLEIEVLHANLDYVDWVSARHDFTVDDYTFYALDSYFLGVGDWVFSSALYDDPQWRNRQFAESVCLAEQQYEQAVALHESAPEFVAELAQHIVEGNPDLVGLTSTFQQNIPALAVLRAIKRRAPWIRTALGGANCDGEQGAAIHRNFEWVDYVVRGEGEQAFPALLRGLGDAGSLGRIPGLCWREQGRAQVNPLSGRPLPAGAIRAPDYTGYFERLEASVAGSWVEPKLVVEGARGCWWGEKHHCTFCGLNGSTMQFRSKSPSTFLAEIVRLVRQHQVLDMFVVDNILDMGFVRTMLPELADSGYDLRIQYEIKSNMRGAQLETLAAAGLVNVQPGIENLHSHVLGLMDKGVTGAQNVRMLRDAATHGISVAWNYLYGFPGETESDYLSIIEQMPALHHLPPMSGVSRIAVERFSPYFDRPELGFADLDPHPQYALNYALPEAELRDLAYLFSAPERGITDEFADSLVTAARRWEEEFTSSRLSRTELDGEILLLSSRKSFDWSVLRIRDPAEIALFRLLDQPRTQAALRRALPEVEVAAVLARWLGLGIVFTESDQYVHIAPLATNQHLLRIDSGRPREAA